MCDALQDGVNREGMMGDLPYLQHSALIGHRTTGSQGVPGHGPRGVDTAPRTLQSTPQFHSVGFSKKSRILARTSLASNIHP